MSMKSKMLALSLMALAAESGNIYAQTETPIRENLHPSTLNKKQKSNRAKKNKNAKKARKRNRK